LYIMLKKINKFTSEEIKNLFKKENSSFKVIVKRTIFFDIKVICLDVESFKAGVVISGKLFKKAVERNKIKRKIFSIIESYTKEHKKNMYILIFPKKDIVGLKFLDLKKELYNTLNNF
ncbi:MAG: Ribonuclease, partial [Candidatus Parcubacteria bacterium]